MTAKDFIAAIELGSSKLTGIAGKKNSDGSIQVLAYAQEEASSFIRKGTVDNIDKTALALTSIINKLEAELEATISKVYVGIGGQSLRSKKNSIAHQMGEETKIQKELVDAIMQNNLQTHYTDQDILEVIPQEYKVKNNLTNEPIGTVSNQIEGRFLNIVARSAIKQNLLTSFKQADLDVAELLIAPIALGDAVLTEVEKRTGCVLVDFGYATTTVSVYKSNLLRHLAVLPLGGNNLTKDICSLQIEESEAEMLKIKYGCAYTDPEDIEPESRSYSVGDKQISAKTLNDIIEARMEEIIANILHQVDLSGFRDKLTGGFILTGGGSNLKKLNEAFTIRHKISKVRIANSVQWEIRSTRPELLIKNGMLNTLFGLLAAGKENCAKVETPKVQNTPKDLFDAQVEVNQEDEEQKRIEQERLEKERLEKEKEAEQIALDDSFWQQCQDKEAWDDYLKQYPEGGHVQEAQSAKALAEKKKQEEEDDLFWEECRKNKQWKKYLKKYPEGRHAQEAKDELNKEPGFLGKLGEKLKKLSEEVLNEE